MGYLIRSAPGVKTGAFLCVKSEGGDIFLKNLSTVGKYYCRMTGHGAGMSARLPECRQSRLSPMTGAKLNPLKSQASRIAQSWSGKCTSIGTSQRTRENLDHDESGRTWSYCPREIEEISHNPSSHTCSAVRYKSHEKTNPPT